MLLAVLTKNKRRQKVPIYRNNSIRKDPQKTQNYPACLYHLLSYKSIIRFPFNKILKGC